MDDQAAEHLQPFPGLPQQLIARTVRWGLCQLFHPSLSVSAASFGLPVTLVNIKTGAEPAAPACAGPSAGCVNFL